MKVSAFRETFKLSTHKHIQSLTHSLHTHTHTCTPAYKHTFKKKKSQTNNLAFHLKKIEERKTKVGQKEGTNKDYRKRRPRRRQQQRKKINETNQ